jgi:hypothetical protein
MHSRPGARGIAHTCVKRRLPEAQRFIPTLTNAAQHGRKRGNARDNKTFAARVYSTCRPAPGNYGANAVNPRNAHAS